MEPTTINRIIVTDAYGRTTTSCGATSARVIIDTNTNTLHVTHDGDTRYSSVSHDDSTPKESQQ